MPYANVSVLRVALLMAGLTACNSEPAGSAAGSAAPPAAAGVTAAAGALGVAGAKAGTGGSFPVPNTTAGKSAGAGQPSVGASAGAGGAPISAGASGQTTPDAGLVVDAGSMLDAAVGPDGSMPSDAGVPSALNEYAKGLHELFMDVPCESSTAAPLANMATCAHAPNTQRIEKMVTFGGDTGKTYVVKLRVRGIWEPTKIEGGAHPYDKVPFAVGGTVPAGTSSNSAINYQQYFLSVSAPKQVCWLNDHAYVAHDIHKQDYQAEIKVSGGAKVVVTMNDGNDHEIANWTKDYFAGLPPYDTKPSLGQMLRLDVVSVTEQP
ncbi:MAG: hypothetical protein RL701_4711 [Pseudomonadota bacterium]|jgi:hypothetical protein